MVGVPGIEPDEIPDSGERQSLSPIPLTRNGMNSRAEAFESTGIDDGISIGPWNEVRNALRFLPQEPFNPASRIEPDATSTMEESPPDEIETMSERFHLPDGDPEETRERMRRTPDIPPPGPGRLTLEKKRKRFPLLVIITIHTPPPANLPPGFNKIYQEEQERSVFV